MRRWRDPAAQDVPLGRDLLRGNGVLPEWMCKTLIREKQFGPHFVAEELRRREEAHTRYSKLQLARA